MFDETALVPRLATAPAERVLERGEGADESDELDQRAVERDRHVHPREAWPAQYEQTTERHEHDERQVDEQNEICKPAEHHAAIVRRGGRPVKRAKSFGMT